MNMYLKIVLALCLSLIVTACGKHEQPKTLKASTYKVAPAPLHKTLHFTGTIQPLHENTLVSPMEAVIETMHFHYGQLVKKGEVVLTLNSNELQKQYNETLTDYLKAKDSFSITKAKFSGTQDLWESGLISKNNYLSEKSSIDTSRVTLMQATRKLTELLEKMDDKTAQNLSALSLADFEKVRSILTSNHNLIHLKAPSAGVMLYPPKSGEDKSTRLTTGSAVKSGQVLALVGDLNGVSVEIDVPEIDIDKIRPGMQATISGIAFGAHKLQGKLVSINAQASSTGTAGLPSFTAVVEVHALTPKQQHWIKVGMSAEIELNVDSHNQLFVPIAAIKREKGNSVVNVQLAQGNIKKTIITTGTAQADTVVVESGLKEGDVIVYD